ncbi:hypothetical protein ACVWZR_001534 [Bradyrhizobium sp. i1.3.1]
MAVATYGSENYYSVISNRRGALQRPLQVALIAGDFVAVLLSYFVASGLYRVLVIEQDSSVGAGLVVGAVFVTIAYFQGVYDHHRLLSTVWQLRKALAVWLISLTILAVEAFLLKSSADLSRGTTLLFAATGGVALGGLRVLWRLALTSSYAKGRLVDRKVVLLSLSSLSISPRPGSRICASTASTSCDISCSIRLKRARAGITRFATSPVRRARRMWKNISWSSTGTRCRFSRS